MYLWFRYWLCHTHKVFPNLHTHLGTHLSIKLGMSLVSLWHCHWTQCPFTAWSVTVVTREQEQCESEVKVFNLGSWCSYFHQEEVSASKNLFYSCCITWVTKWLPLSLGRQEVRWCSLAFGSEGMGPYKWDGLVSATSPQSTVERCMVWLAAWHGVCT